MALFKPFRGTRATLPQELHDGYAYFCTDDGSFHIDYVDAEGKLQRKQINAKDAETLVGMSLDEIKEYVAVQPDWNISDAANNAYIANKPDIRNGSADKAIVIGEGEATGSYSVAGGTNDKSLVKNLAGDLASLIGNIDVAKAQGDMSLSFGAGTKARTAGSMAIGANTNAGVKGFYWFNVSGKTLTLSTKQPSISVWSAKWDATAQAQLNNWAAGDTITVVNDANYVMCATIASISNSASAASITVNEDLPFTERASVLTNVLFDDFSVINHNKPDAGTVALGLGSVSIGLQNEAHGLFSYAEGRENLAAGNFAHAEGLMTKAAHSSHSEGYKTNAKGNFSHAENSNTTSSGENSHAEGLHTESGGTNSHAEGNNTKAMSINSHAEGYGTEVTGESSHAEGLNVKVYGNDSHGEGYMNTIENTASHAHVEGARNVVKANSAHAEGDSTIASSFAQHVQGKYNVEDSASKYAHIVGGGTSDSDRRNIHTLDWNGNAYFSGVITDKNGEIRETLFEPCLKNATAISSSGESLSKNETIYSLYSNLQFTIDNSYTTDIDGESSGLADLPYKYVLSKLFPTANKIQPGMYSWTNTYRGTIGYPENKTTLNREGITKLIETNADKLREEFNNLSSGEENVQSDWNVTDSSSDAYIKNKPAIKSGTGQNSTVEGSNCQATSKDAHAEGVNCIASGLHAHAEGSNTKASGSDSHAEGEQTIASSAVQHVQGRYNEVLGGDYYHIVGNGTADNARSNAHWLKKNGDAWFAGTVSDKNGELASFDALFPEKKELVDITDKVMGKYYEIPTDDTKIQIYTEQIHDFMNLVNPSGNNEIVVNFKSGTTSPYTLPDDLETYYDVNILQDFWRAGGLFNISICDKAYSYLFVEQTDKTAVSPTTLSKILDEERIKIKEDVIDSIGEIKTDLPVEKGEENNSLVIGEGKVLSEQSIASGQDEDGSVAIAGVKGFFYYTYSTNTLTLSTVQGREEWNDEAQEQLNKWVTGTKLNVVGSHKHTMCSTVQSISGNVVTVDKLPFGDQIPFDTDNDNKYKAVDWNTLTNPDWDDGAVYASELPEAGIIPFGRGARSIGANTQAIGTYSVAEGKQTLAANDFAHAEGRWTKAGYASHAEGYSSLAIGQGAHAEGHGTNASAHSSHAEGNRSVASGNAAHAEGYYAQATGQGSHAEGNNTIAKGAYAHAEGLRNSDVAGAAGTASHVEGANGEASGNYSHVEGLNCKTKSGASGAHAEGEWTEANAQYSHAEGWHTTIDERSGHVQGKYNKSKSGYAHVVGNGSENAPSDAHTLDWNGNAWFAGSITLGDVTLTKEQLSKLLALISE